MHLIPLQLNWKHLPTLFEPSIISKLFYHIRVDLYTRIIKLQYILDELQFRRLNIKEIDAAFPISIVLFFNHLNWNSSKRSIWLFRFIWFWVTSVPTYNLELLKNTLNCIDQWNACLKMMERVDIGTVNLTKCKPAGLSILFISMLVRNGSSER